MNMRKSNHRPGWYSAQSCNALINCWKEIYSWTDELLDEGMWNDSYKYVFDYQPIINSW